ncbi:hypothetical protein AMECASPLE_001425 [Ameca splendens]|uniref:Uncharacterized protein n=1 Tax=Ameca splendens TaxID=208324 RepID=A0ABV0ZIH1_9TELE
MLYFIDSPELSSHRQPVLFSQRGVVQSQFNRPGSLCLNRLDTTKSVHSEKTRAMTVIRKVILSGFFVQDLNGHTKGVFKASFDGSFTQNTPSIQNKRSIT